MNNIVEQDHRGIKSITKYTLGFKSFESAEATMQGLSCIECLKKDRWKTQEICPPGNNFMNSQHNYVLNKAALNFI